MFKRKFLNMPRVLKVLLTKCFTYIITIIYTHFTRKLSNNLVDIFFIYIIAGSTWTGSKESLKKLLHFPLKIAIIRNKRCYDVTSNKVKILISEHQLTFIKAPATGISEVCKESTIIKFFSNYIICLKNKNCHVL